MDGYFESHDDMFDAMIAESIEYMNNKNRRILEDWCKEIGYNEPIGYYNQLGYEYTMTIYATRPGVLIGKGGKNVDLLKSMLTEEFRISDYKIKFVEIRGGIVNLNKSKPKRKLSLRHFINLFRR